MAAPSPSPRQSPVKSSPPTESWDAETDTNALFKNHSVEEIRSMESKTRGDIEKKKEELRQMVGERYRDLIDAADTISVMKECSGQVVSCIDNVQRQCKDLRQVHNVHGVGGQAVPPGSDIGIRNPKTGFYSIASQMKLLVDTPEMVWSALEEKQYLKATRLYLLAQHIVSSLHIDPGNSTQPKLLASFPILSRQWSSISHFKDSILQGSRTLLKDASQTEEVLSESLCSILLLDNSSPRQVFTEFLLARRTALQDLFHSSQQATSIKSQICGVVKLVETTLYQICHLFYSGEAKLGGLENTDKPSLLFESLKQATKKRDFEKEEESVLRELFGTEFDLLTVSRHLPTSVLNFHPRLRAFPALISGQAIINSCTEWIATCVADVAGGVGELLKYIGTLKGLASIRDSVWDLLDQQQKDSASYSLLWTDVCQKILNKELSIWDEFLRPTFLQRAKETLQGMFDNSVSSTKSLVKQSLEDLSALKDPLELWDRDIASYVWHESPGDIPSCSAQTGLDGLSTQAKGRGLMYKARACTPSVQKLCSHFDSRLANILEDAQFFISNNERKNEPEKLRKPSWMTSTETQTASESCPFDKFADAQEVKQFLQTACISSIFQLVRFVDEILLEYKDKLKSTPTDGSFQNNVVVDRTLYLGKFCRAMTEQCSHFTQIILTGVPENAQSPARLPKSPAVKKKTETEKNKKMAEVMGKLKKCHHSAHRIWSEWISRIFLTSFDTNLLGGQEAVLISAMTWDEISIEEETESGVKVQSTVHVPMQVSSFILSLLFSMCEEINRIGGHAVERVILQELIRDLSEGVLSSYENLLSHHDASSHKMNQTRALQVLFDVKFLSSVLAGRLESTDDTSHFDSRLQNVIDKLEHFIDPFDLNVFTPHLNSNINKHLQRCGVLLGALVSVDKHASHSFGMAHRPTPGSHEQHNLLPLTPNPVRFNLLPLSSHHTPELHSKTSSQSLKDEAESLPWRKSFSEKAPFYKNNLFLSELEQKV